MARPTVEKLLEDIQALPAGERRRLLALVDGAYATDAAHPPKRSLLELYGVGREMWSGVDAQAYVEALRSEWGDPRDPTR